MDIQIQGLSELYAKLDNLSRIEETLRPWGERTLKAAKDETDYTQSEPPRRAGQKYIRTFRLRGGWVDRISITGNGITAERRNSSTPYGPFVMGRSAQTSVFAGRWPTDASIEQKIAPSAIDDLQRVVQSEIDS